MANGLSSQSEQYHDQVVASGLFPSKEAAVVAQREENDRIPFVPDEQMDRVEQAIKSADGGRLSADDGSRLVAPTRLGSSSGHRRARWRVTPKVFRTREATDELSQLFRCIARRFGCRN